MSRRLLGLGLVAACAGDPATCDTELPRSAPRAAPTNALVIVLDDVGLDHLGGFDVANPGPPTPTLDGLAAEGVRFTRAYALPSCTPTRAAMLTGRHARRTGAGWWLQPRDENWSLPDAERTLPELLAAEAHDRWSTALVGKWHLTAFSSPDPGRAPLRQGFDHFRGMLGNPDMALERDGTPFGHERWEKFVDGRRSITTAYTTTDQIDEALALATDLPSPWLVWVGLSASHSPWTPPPAKLNRTGVGASDPAPERLDALTVAADVELGRLLDGLPPEVRDDTTVIVMGDNGTPGDAVGPPLSPDRAKNTVYEGGVRVPLIVAGPDVTTPGASSEALVHAVDVFATVADLAGIDLDALPTDDPEVDGRSLLPLVRDPTRTDRRCLMVEQFLPIGDSRPDRHDIAVIGPRYKLLAERGEDDQLLDLSRLPLDDGDALDLRSAPDDARLAERELRQARRAWDWALR